MTTLVLTLLLTIAVEFLILWPLTRRPPLKVLVYSILINSLTQPAAAYVYRNVTLSDQIPTRSALLASCESCFRPARNPMVSHHGNPGDIAEDLCYPERVKDIGPRSNSYVAD